MDSLENKTAVVTGSSKGIGRATALTLARAGANLAISARSEAPLANLAKEIEALGRRVLVFPGDMASEDDITAFIERTVETFGSLDILVNNAGIGHFGPIAEMSTAYWDEMFNLNVRGVFIATRQALPHLRKAGEAVVVNVVSMAGKNFFVGGGGYAASKHAVLGFSRCLMLEERKNGIRVLAICPGSVDTPFFDSPTTRHMASNRDKILKPQDIADTVLHMIRLPQRATISEIDIRPANP